MKALKKAGLAFLATALFLGGWAFWWEPSGFHVVHRTLTLNPWHPQHDKLKVAVLADLHVGSPYVGLEKLRAVVQATNAEKPDLVLLLGDYVIQGVAGGTFIQPEAIVQELAKLHAPLGVTAVLGNHDWWFNGEHVRTALASQGIRVLESSCQRVTLHGKSFWLAGFTDLWTRGDHVAETLAQIKDKDPIIALMHNPDLFPEVPARVSLSLAGHTHGGQVNLPFLGRLVVPSKFGQRFAYGLIDEGGRQLFVTAGIGTSIIPVRFRVRPEIVILELKSGEQ